MAAAGGDAAERAGLRTPSGAVSVAASHVWSLALALAEQHSLSVYDATYLELTLRMRLPLATLDGALAVAAQAAGPDAPGGA